ncbi:YxeA family protein [Sporosarcina sp. FSL K6-2383]|uniref:YxeA family protein n=1 Tax=Sporosarcina sp. FSL K6-2383 TaxID=2921556 RepID=UPI00315A1259
MKKLIVTIVVIAVIVGLILGLRNINPNRLGADSYYIQITDSGDTIEDKISTGEVMIRYEYTLPAFDKKGNKKELTFTSGHELRKDAYINLFWKENKGVTSYQEVQKEDIPEKALNELKR